jgi:hypothetical protein
VNIPRQRDSEPPPNVVVGVRQHGGQLSATPRVNKRGSRIVVNAVELTGLAVDVSLADAHTFAVGLLELVEQARGRRTVGRKVSSESGL